MTITIGIVVKIAVDSDLVPQYPAPITNRIAMAIARFTLTVRYTYPVIATITGEDTARSRIIIKPIFDLSESPP